MDAYVVSQAGAGFVLGAVLLHVACTVSARGREEPYRRPARMFALWWAGLGAAWWAWALDAILVDAAPGQAGAVALLDFGLVLLYFILILMSFASLFYYLLFLYSGREAFSRAVWILYGSLTIALLVLFGLVNRPSGYLSTGITAAVFGPYQAAADALRIALLLPVVVASLALFLVMRRTPGAKLRRRVLLVSVSLFLYLLVPLFFPSNPGIQPQDALGWAREGLNKLAIVGAIAAVLVAYRRRHETEPPAGRPPHLGRTTLEERVRALV